MLNGQDCIVTGCECPKTLSELKELSNKPIVVLSDTNEPIGAGAKACIPRQVDAASTVMIVEGFAIAGQREEAICNECDEILAELREDGYDVPV